VARCHERNVLADEDRNDMNVELVDLARVSEATSTKDPTRASSRNVPGSSPNIRAET
jgi:hypothetical protein